MVSKNSVFIKNNYIYGNIDQKIENFVVDFVNGKYDFNDAVKFLKSNTTKNNRIIYKKYTPKMYLFVIRRKNCFFYGL